MKYLIALVFIIISFSINILADIPPPPVGEKLQIELRQNYPEYQFYIASYDLKVVPNPNPPHVSRPNMIVTIPETFNFRQIDLSVEKPFMEAITSARIQNRGTLVGKSLWLVAVKKSLDADVESKVKDAIDNGKNGDGIYTEYLSQSLEVYTSDRVGAKVILNTVTALNENGMKINVSEGSVSTLTGTKASLCIALGLILTGMAFAGIWWTNKKRV